MTTLSASETTYDPGVMKIEAWLGGSAGCTFCPHMVASHIVRRGDRAWALTCPGHVSKGVAQLRHVTTFESNGNLSLEEAGTQEVTTVTFTQTPDKG